MGGSEHRGNPERPASPHSLDQAQAPRLAALWAPDWPVAAALAESLTPAHLPVAVHDARMVTAVSAPARAEGVRRGMTRRTAQSLCADLVLVPRDEGRDVRAFEPVAQAVETVVAAVEVMRPGVIVIPARGPSRHYGSEERLADLLVGAVARISGVECQVGLADGLLAALLAAREGVIVPAGASAQFLAPRDVRDLLHVAVTRDSHAAWGDLVHLLRRLGARTLGAFAAMRPGDVAARFGVPGVRGHRLARGLDAADAAARRPAPDVRVHTVLDPPAARIDAAAFAARRMAEELHTRMLRRGSSCARLRVLVRAEDGQEVERTWRVDGALTASEVTDRVRWQLEGWLTGRSGQPPSAPLARVEIVAEEVTAAGTGQEGLWGRRGRGERQAARAALRVQGLLGAERVLTATPQGGRTPQDQVRMAAWGDEPAGLRPLTAPWPGRLPEPLPATVPAEEVPIEVVDRTGAALDVDSRGALTPTGSAPAIVRCPGQDAVPLASGNYRVDAWAGPWPVRERWWSAEPRQRAFLQLVLADGPALLACVEDGRWQVAGVYD